MNRKGRSVGWSFTSLPPQERCKRYREMADAAFLKAQYVKDREQRAEYLSMAAGWHAMALEMEADIKRLTQLEDSQDRLRKAMHSKRDEDMR